VIKMQQKIDRSKKGSGLGRRGNLQTWGGTPRERQGPRKKKKTSAKEVQLPSRPDRKDVSTVEMGKKGHNTGGPWAGGSDGGDATRPGGWQEKGGIGGKTKKKPAHQKTEPLRKGGGRKLVTK